MPSQATRSDSDIRSLVEHDIYYIPGGDLHILVEHVLFRVHRYFFVRESQYFKDKLTLPASPGQGPHGDSASTAVVLENDVTSADFAKFLWVFYNPKYSIYHAPHEDWTVILSLANRWGFPEVKNLAVREMELLDVDVIDRVAIYQKHEVDKRVLVPHYTKLIARDEAIKIREGLKLGIETALNLARAREIARSPLPRDGGRSPLPAESKEEDVQAMIMSLFNISPPAPKDTSPSPAPPPTSSGSTGTAANHDGSNGTGAGLNGTASNQNGTGNGAHPPQPTGKEGVELHIDPNPRSRGQGSGGRSNGTKGNGR